MTKIKIGLPRTYLYYKYGIFLKSYFEFLGCNVILSPITNNKIIKQRNKSNMDKLCFSSIIFLSHLNYLKDISDYILVLNESSNCNIINKIKDDIIPKEKIINLNINYFSIIKIFKISLKFTKNPLKIIISYILAKEKQKKYNKEQENNQINKLNQSNQKILIVGQYYNIEDNYFIKYINSFLKTNSIISIYSNKINKKITNQFYKYSLNKSKNYSIKQILSSINYYKYRINGIIYITVDNCILDKYIYKLIKQEPDLPPILNIKFKENIQDYYLETELEYFIKKLGD